MFAVDPAAADAIRRAFHEDGELAAIVELRRHFPLLASTEHARNCVQAIAGWGPIAPRPPRRRAKKPQAAKGAGNQIVSR